MRFKYVGPKKGGVPVTFPLGNPSRMAVRKVVYAEPFIDIADEESALFLRLYNHAGERPVFVEADASESTEPLKVREVDAAVPKKKRGRKPKLEVTESVE